jgi:thiamine-phosphate pyrophosphorylase
VPTPDFDLYLVTDRSLTQGRDLLWVLQQALDGGVKAIQLREKDLGGRELFFLAEAARKLTRRYHARLLINDRIDIALAVDADGVHLSTASIPIESARALLGRQRLLGASTHSLEEAEEAERNGADFVVFGPIYFTPSKAPYGSPQGSAALKKVVDKISLPIYAIGGIKPENIADTCRAGVCGVALISAVMSAADPKNATKKILSFLKR